MTVPLAMRFYRRFFSQSKPGFSKSLADSTVNNQNQSWDGDCLIKDGNLRTIAHCTVCIRENRVVSGFIQATVNILPDAVSGFPKICSKALPA